MMTKHRSRLAQSKLCMLLSKLSPRIDNLYPARQTQTFLTLNVMTFSVMTFSTKIGWDFYEIFLVNFLVNFHKIFLVNFS